MIRMIIVAILSFVLGFIFRTMLERIKNKKRLKKVKPLSKMTKSEFKQAMKDLEIK